jgi:hypothetical protein
MRNRNWAKSAFKSFVVIVLRASLQRGRKQPSGQRKRRIRRTHDKHGLSEDVER